MSYLYKETRTCECGYSTLNRSNWCGHKKRCRFHVQQDTEKEQLMARVAEQSEQLKAKDEQLATKDKQIEELLRMAKKPRTTQNTQKNITVNTNTNNTNNTNNTQHINVFGKESLAHISDEKIQELLADPETSIERMIALTHSVPENMNVRVPNSREKWVEVLTIVDGVPTWNASPKTSMLDVLVEETATMLEERADTSTAVGARYSRWYDRLQDSYDVRGKMFMDQCDRAHRSLVALTRK